MFSVNVLVYGDHPELAARCLGSIVNSWHAGLIAEIRVGMNAACAATRDLVLSTMRTAAVPFLVYEEVAGANVMKYPLMRRMLYDPGHPIPDRATHVMWFDDDSFVTAGHRFWHDCAAQVAKHAPAVMGSVYLPAYHWSPLERHAIVKQPWFSDMVPMDVKPRFATGGWWVAALEFLAKMDYPVRELRHNGGDVLLGEMVRQWGHRLHHFRDGVAINADAGGKESKARRRGVTTKRPFEAHPPYDYTHHDFKVRVLTNGHGEGER